MQKVKIISICAIFSIIVIACLAVGTKKKYKVLGFVTETYSLCGGARPPKELEEASKTPRALANKKIIVRKGNINSQKAKIIAELVTNEEGKFELELPAGTYCFMSKEKAKLVIPANDEFNAYDVDCLKKEFTKPDGLLTVKEGENKIEINFHNYCFYKKPCLTYTGELPQ